MRTRTPQGAHLRHVVSLLVGLLLGATSPSAAAFGQQTYYLSPEGDDRNTGPVDEPWATLAMASQEVRAGDTVVLLEGTYEGTLRPAHSGTAEAPITFRAAERRTARLVGGTGDAYAVHLDGVAHINIEGLHIRPRSPAEGRFMKIERARHVQVDECLMEKTAGVFHAGWGRPFDFFGEPTVLFENNIIAHAYHGYISAGPEAKDPFDGTITIDDPDNDWWWFWYRSRPNPGLPLGLYIQGFDDGGQERRVYVALHEAIHLPPESRRAGTAQFVADGLWHTIEIDARSIRDHYPAVNVLQEIRSEAVGLGQVEEGESFWLDEFYIARDAYDVEHAGLAAGSNSLASSQTVRISGEDVQARLIYAEDFEDMDDWVHLAGDSTRWSIEDGRLVGRYGPGGSTVWSRPSFDGDVLVEFDGKVLPPDEPWITESMPDGGKNLNFHFMVTGRDGDDILEAYPALHRAGTGPNGAGFDQYNGYFLTWTYRHARLRRSPGYENADETLSFLPEINEPYRFRLLRRDGRIRYWINDRLVLDYTDPHPWQRGSVGFTLWRSNVAVDNFKVYRLLDAQDSP